MSSDAIYDQLVSEYGEKFTPEQANYAISNLPQ
ncbi:Ltp family lipoprotein [Corynebacterium pseudotuberculosis]|nr:Ltp family lipoprotein [Corynebacterium pseudotuberculosis]